MQGRVRAAAGRRKGEGRDYRQTQTEPLDTGTVVAVPVVQDIVSNMQFMLMPGETPQRVPVVPQRVLLQLPALQVTPMQSLLQVPQWAGSKRTSRQVPPQSTKGMSQAAPVVHAGCPCCAPQARHVPDTLTVRPVQTPPEQAGWSSPPQVRQVPDTLTVPVVQAVPDTQAG